MRPVVAKNVAVFFAFLCLSASPLDAYRINQVAHAASKLTELHSELQEVLQDLEAAAEEDKQNDVAETSDDGRCCCQHGNPNGTVCSVLHPPAKGNNLPESETLKEPTFLSPNFIMRNEWVCPGKDHEKKGIEIKQAKNDAERSQCGFDWTSCSTLKQDFEEQAVIVDGMVKQTGGFTSMSSVELAKTVLRTRLLIKTMSSAQKKGCSWLQDKSVDKSALQDIVKQTAGKSPCFEQATKVISSMPEGDAQKKGFETAIRMIISDKCEPSESIISEKPIKDDADVQAEVNILELETDQSANELERQTNVDGLQSEWKGVALLEELQTVQLQGNMELSNAGEIFAKIFALIFLAILWALFCWVILFITLMIIGFLMCTIKTVVVALVNIFKKDKWDSDWKMCMGWWAGVFGHSDAYSVSVPICAASIMTNAYAR